MHPAWGSDYLGHASLPSTPNMSGDRVRMGWRALVGAMLVGLVLLHGFDRSFSFDGYTVGLLGMLLVLALAGELESATFAGFDVRFRRRALMRIEEEVEDLPSPDTQPEDDDVDEAAANELREERTEQTLADLRSLARDEPRAAIITFFVDVERDIGRLYELLHGVAEQVPFRRQVDALTQYGVIPPSEARIVLDLASLRNAYVHGRAVDPDEATRLLTVGERILPSPSRTKRTLGSAFEQQVSEILASVPDLSFERRSHLVAGDMSYDADFVTTSPVRYVIEARLINRSPGDERFSGMTIRLEHFLARSDMDGGLMVVPRIPDKRLAQLSAKTSLTVLPIDHLRAWLEGALRSRET